MVDEPEPGYTVIATKQVSLPREAGAIRFLTQLVGKGAKEGQELIPDV